MKLVVIPSDQLIVLDGKPISTTFDAPENLHALHFNGTTIRQELTNSEGMYEEYSSDTALVQPYLEAVKAEIERRKQASVVVEPTAEEQAQQRAVEIERKLKENDLASVRSLRAKVSGTATDADDKRLQELEAEAQELRVQLAGTAQIIEQQAEEPETEPQDACAELATLVAELDELSN